MLPSGESEFAGQEAGTKTGSAELVKPSTVALALDMIAACVILVSFARISTEKDTESVVTCNKRREWPVVEAVTGTLLSLRFPRPGIMGKNMLLKEKDTQYNGKNNINPSNAVTLLIQQAPKKIFKYAGRSTAALNNHHPRQLIKHPQECRRRGSGWCHTPHARRRQRRWMI